MENIIWFDQLSNTNVDKVGGKNASLGEMIQHLSKEGVCVPNGFATTADAFREFLKENDLQNKINAELKDLNINDVKALSSTGKKIRQWVLDGAFSESFKKDVKEAFKKLEIDNEGTEKVSVAVRSSATAEDLPTASFAGQQETYLNVSGLDNLFLAIKKVFASLFNDRAISYRVHQGFEHEKVALSASIQYMVRSDLASSGVMFTLDTESGFKDVVFINAAYGLGETVVQGAVNPDEYVLYKPNLLANRPAILRKTLGEKAIKMIYSDPVASEKDPIKTVDVSDDDRLQFSLTNEELQELALNAVKIEKHYGQAMDIEWAKDGQTGKLYIVQARPETVKNHANLQVLTQYKIDCHGELVTKGHSIGQKIGKGVARVLNDISEMDKVKPGDVLVTDMTDPDWEPIMKKASAIVTNRGGRTCHAAIVARELGIPAVVGCSDATTVIKDGQEVTISCAEGDVGYVYEGLSDYDIEELNVETMPKLPLKIMMNVGNPECAFNFSFIPNHGVGLARLEFIIAKMIGIHPNALLNFDKLDEDTKKTIRKRIACYDDPINFYVDKLSEGIATIAAAFYPKPVIVRTSDFKSNEYANLLGGAAYEPEEENPMIGFRGASRYVDEKFKPAFELECRALRKVRDEMGLTNVEVMIPFTRTVSEAKAVVDLLAENGLKRGENGLRLIMMCEIPSNAILADEFLEYFDGFSIGSNDLTQLTLGLDRDSGLVAKLFDERNDAVKFFLDRAITACNKANKYIGICGQGPSDYPDLAEWLVDHKIGSISLNPDTVIQTWLYLAKRKDRK